MATYDIATQTIDPSILQAGDILNCSYTGTEKNITLPVGTYKMEVWGGGGGANTSGYHSFGGYSYGTFAITEPTPLYFNIGGGSTTTDKSAKYNGGGSTSNYGGCGGGATHIALRSGLLSALSSYRSDIIIVAGGGGGSGYSSCKGGDGGGTSGSSGSAGTSSGGTGGTQSAGGSGGGTGTFGQGANASAGGGGGGGWYGGGAGIGGSKDSAGGGGSGYINTTLLTDAVTTTQSSRSGNGYATITILDIERATEYDISSLPFVLGENQITVSATGTGYRESFQSDPIIVTTYKLSAPTISMAEGIITFSAISHATLYEVYADGDMIGTSADVAIDITTLPGFEDLEEREYGFTVKATNPDSYLYFDSDASNEVDYTVVKVPQLDPTLDTAFQSGSDTVIEWSEIDNAVGYDIMVEIDGEYVKKGEWEPPATGEMWVINESPDTSYELNIDINFNSNNTNFSLFQTVPSLKPPIIRYVKLGETDIDVYDDIFGWADQAYRTVTFDEPVTGELLTWFNSPASDGVAPNAVKQ